MSYQKSARYYRAADIAIYISEGHTLDETVQEFRLSKRQIERDLDLLAGYGTWKQDEFAIKLYVKAKRQLAINCNRIFVCHQPNLEN